MMRVALSVEGATERDFVRLVLEPHFRPRDMALVAVSLDGRVSLDRAIPELRRLSGSFDAVGTFYDYYGFRRREARSADEIERALAEGVVNARRPVPYIQMHDFEALLFADGQVTAGVLGDTAKAAELADASRRAGGPERINDRAETCPKARLRTLFRHYDPVLHGPRIAERIGLAALRAACPRFDGWIARLEALASAP